MHAQLHPSWSFWPQYYLFPSIPQNIAQSSRIWRALCSLSSILPRLSLSISGRARPRMTGLLLRLKTNNGWQYEQIHRPSFLFVIFLYVYCKSCPYIPQRLLDNVLINRRFWPSVVTNTLMHMAVHDIYYKNFMTSKRKTWQLPIIISQGKHLHHSVSLNQSPSHRRPHYSFHWDKR